jgi:heterodisulfide reductase subunit B
MKRLALFRCCVTSLRLQHYESATNAVLGALGVAFEDVAEFGCCGYPLKNFDFKAYVLSAARNLALAEKKYLDIMTSCNCCYGSLKQAQKLLDEDLGLLRDINGMLSKEGLYYRGQVKVFSVLEVFHDLLSAGAIQKHVTGAYSGLKVAVHDGCHLLRPSNVVAFDHPLAPKKFDALVALTGAQSVPWAKKLECCGSPLSGVNDALAENLGRTKLESARQAGADLVCVICPYCQIQFNWVQDRAARSGQTGDMPTSLYYHQLLGLCLGIDPERLGITAQQLQATGVQRALQPVAKDSEVGTSSAA